MAKIVVGSPSLTQPLLLYLGLGPAMLDNIGEVNIEELSGSSQVSYLLTSAKIICLGLLVAWVILAGFSLVLEWIRFL
jgi:hypothetical protein